MRLPGILILAHGGSPEWNKAVEDAVAGSHLTFPTAVAFGMGMHEHEVQDLREAAGALESKGITRLVVVPLLVSSHSEVYRQYEYLLGLRHDAEWPDAGQPLTYEIPVTLTSALDGDPPMLASILLDRAKALSRAPAKETVVLVAHGPNEDADNAKWLAALQQAADSVQQQGGFARVMPCTIRDDARDEVRAQAREALREMVQTQSRQRRILVIPVLIAQGGIEQKIPEILKGLRYVFKGQTLLPHPKISQWISKQALKVAEGR